MEKNMTDFKQDIHALLRYSVSGYLFIVIMLLYFNCGYTDLFTKNISALGGLMTAFLVLGWILGFIFFSLFQLVFNVGWRKKHFLDLIHPELSKNNGCSFWEPEFINDQIIYQKIKDNDFQVERDRITFLTSKFYMFGSIITSLLIVIVVILILNLVSSNYSLSFILSILLLSFFLIYSFIEISRNYHLVKEFNKHLIQKMRNLTVKKNNGG